MMFCFPFDSHAKQLFLQGICEGMTYEEIQETYPEEFSLRDADKYHYRYQGGEVGTLDGIQRLNVVFLVIIDFAEIFLNI